MTAGAGMAGPQFGLVDSHIHQWDPYTTPRQVSAVAKIVRRVPVLEPALIRAFPASDRAFIGDPRYVLRPYLVHDYVGDVVPEVESVVHIEASWAGHSPQASVDETAWIDRLPFGQSDAPALGAVVVHADPRSAHISELLSAHLAASPRVRGVRCSAAHHPDRRVKSWTDRPHLLAQCDFLRGFAAIAERGLSFDAWVYSHQLPDVEVLAVAYPETTIVLDHYATPVGALGPVGDTGRTHAQRADIYHRWADDMAALAERPNVVAKHSGAAMPVLGIRAAGKGLAVEPRVLRDAVAPFITHTHRLFGNDRTLWGSNYPIDKPNQTIATSITMLHDVLGERLDPRKVLRENARRVYRI